MSTAARNQVRQKDLADVNRSKVIDVHGPTENFRLQGFSITRTGNASTIDNQVWQAIFRFELGESLTQGRFIGDVS